MKTRGVTFNDFGGDGQHIYHQTVRTLSIECPSSIFFLHVLYFIVSFFLSFLSCACFVLFSSSLSLVEVCRCSSDLFLSSRSRTGLATTYITGY